MRWGRKAARETVAWTPPGALEQALLHARQHADWTAYFNALAPHYLYFATPRGPVDAVRQAELHPFWNKSLGSHCMAYYTDGMLPVPGDNPVYEGESLRSLASSWPSDRWWLAVNPGTPCEAYFPGTMAHRVQWRAHAEQAPSGQAMLRTLRVGGVLDGPLAHGLACGALLCVSNGSLWNAVAWHGRGYSGERNRLEQAWGITDRIAWLARLEELLLGESLDPLWEVLLRLRQQMTQATGRAPGVAEWQDAAEYALRRSARPAPPTAGARAGSTAGDGDGADAAPDGGPAAGPSHGREPESEPDRGRETGLGRGTGLGRADLLDREVRRARHLIGRIARYESRFRADGLLPEDGQVRSVLAWCYGRASKMARWGLGARYGTMAETERALVRAGRVSQVSYESWEEFSAGYVLGRCLHFDRDEAGSWYTEMLDAHRQLTTDPESPWLRLPWR
ncbi:DUF1266 domain-containing protein [Streptomyces sp. 549]|uniref:DUF1266 domain-containing protein n=1 Tax=Streptomyces sp. 549 TaxID=3049076 RepID=UPI0024C2AD93|nr:DUF1266 domain-containing protein [Streptomyces sp. 549]MDK1472501.1 DUF1266 domain-containing protein [Streptomyces sp. 549]